jgi:hypothetical protein
MVQERPVCACLRRARDRSYKPMVKASGAQRESDGVVVPVIGVQHSAPGGKGPDFGHADQAGRREGMTGVSRSNYPGTGSGVVAPVVTLEGAPSACGHSETSRR